MTENHICRVCFTVTGFFSNFMDFLTDSPYQITILESFNICTHLEAYENDLYSQSLCENCIESLRISFRFIIKAEETDRLLKEKYSNNSFKLDQTDFEDDGNDIVLKEKKLSTNIIEIDPPNIKQEFNNYTCHKIKLPRDNTKEVCRTNSNSNQNVEELNNTTILKDDNLIPIAKRNYECEICDKHLATVSSLRNHMRTHTGEKPYVCKVCNQRFSFAFALTCHKRIHTGEKPYKCEYCGKQFAQHTILKTHLTLHTGKTIECTLCDKKFSRKSNLILHEREHSGEKPYLCHICDKKYLQKCHLDRHIEVHAGIRFKCELCDKEYSKKSSLNYHMYEHTGNKPYECSECFDKFSRKDKYKNHLMKKHNKMLAIDKLYKNVSNTNDMPDVVEFNKS